MRPQPIQAIELPSHALPVPGEAFLTPPKAADYLRSRYGQGTVKSLAKFRCFGGGPAFCRFGPRRVIYRAADLDSWAMARISAIEGC